MKKVTSTLTLLLLCIYVSAQVGSLDAANFNSPNGFVINSQSTGDDYGNSIAIQSTGKIIVAVVTNDKYFTLVRYNTNGTIDGTFGTGGVVKQRLNAGDEAQSYAVAIQGNDSIVVGGYTWIGTNKDFALARFDADGNIDLTFGTNGWRVTAISTVSTSFGEDQIRSLAILSDSSIVAAGYSYNGGNNDFAVAKYTKNGSLVTSFGGSSTGYVTTDVNNADMVSQVAVTNAGEIVVVGTSNIGANTDDYTIVRYTSSGILDGNFNTSGIVTSGIGGSDDGFGVAIQSDDYIVVTGSVPASFSTTDVFVARYQPDGTPDANFDGDGFKSISYASLSNDEGRSVAIQSNGKIVVAGFTDANGSYDFYLARFDANGSTDGTFGTGGQSSGTISSQRDFGYAMKLYSNRIYVAGVANYKTTAPTAPMDFALASFINNFSTLPLTLSNFYGQKQMDKVVLQWQTTMEEDVKQFIIERSSDGRTYKSIGQVNAVGNSTTTQHYSFADQSPFTSTNNYYRLLIQDVDGNTKYSKILIIKFGGELTTNMQLFPNPVKDILQVQIPAGLNGSISLQIIDMSGRIVRKNNIASDGNALSTSIDVSNLQTGLYIIKAQAGNTSVLTRFAKQ